MTIEYRMLDGFIAAIVVDAAGGLGPVSQGKLGRMVTIAGRMTGTGDRHPQYITMGLADASIILTYGRPLTEEATPADIVASAPRLVTMARMQAAATTAWGMVTRAR